MDAMTWVGIISDTHGTLDARAFAALSDCDHIIHAGDICGPAILRELACIAPVTAVLGNNDFPEYGSAVTRFARPVVGGVRFLVAHYPQDVRITYAGSSALAPGDSIPQVLVHGHTHVPKLETGPEARPASLLICPGSASLPRGGFSRSIAKVQVSEGRILEARVESLGGKPIFTWG
ncbi:MULTISPECIES: metallophosphoesterase family protein [unclassified Adlercreutzia]|uniref:metallophosphoesterase family protein n=1 Tax=unclassified Adlercreutzia TaxID=2636013 RepID=UPI001F150DA2|nr:MULTISPECIES: metallophosphoesterase family protein [unclassified Adlercreutzia]